jgi:formylglycine-generating enzyme required for sulfatase activity
MPEPDHRLVPVPSAQLALATNHLALLNKILSPAVLGPVAGRPWEIRDLGLKLVWIEPGTFFMGPRDREAGHNEGPQTKVTLTQPFWLGRTAVTLGQYEQLMGTNRSDFGPARTFPNAPVTLVSWDEARKFCQKLTARERAAGRLPVGFAYTLPTAAQWEYACRAGTTGVFPWDLDAMTCNHADTPPPVGMKEPNAWGLYDMEGNVQEWCRDWYADQLPGGEMTNPRGPPLGRLRVLRGGAWGKYAPNLGHADDPDPLPFDDVPRGNMAVPYNRDFGIGFRLALSSLPTPETR